MTGIRVWCGYQSGCSSARQHGAHILFLVADVEHHVGALGLDLGARGLVAEMLQQLSDGLRPDSLAIHLLAGQNLEMGQQWQQRLLFQ